MAGAAHESALKLLSAELVRRLSHLLVPHGIAVMPLKGALWQATLYESAEARAISDVDVIVPPGMFGRARAILIDQGFVPFPNPQGPHEQALRPPGLPLNVDLHASLFARGRYRLSGHGLFARGSPDRTLFGAEVWLPHPLDQLAHLLGHLATDHRPGDPMYRSDFARLLARHELAPQAVAAHLHAHGLGRASRFALRELSTPPTWEWTEECLRAMKPDPLGEMLARVTREVVRRRGRFSTMSALAGHALNTGPREIAEALAWAAWTRVRQRIS